MRISGGGRCNVTHAGGPAEVLAAFPKAQARFLRPALHAFPGTRLLELLAAEGIRTEARENGRVFPVDGPGSAHRVADALERLARAAGVRIRTGCRIQGLDGTPPRLRALVLEGGARLVADVFILATGGASYPQTGTRGEMAGLLAGLGVPVAPWAPALAPIPLREPRPAWEGVALRGGVLSLRPAAGQRPLARFTGDLLFTRTGVSGPAALELSRETEAARRAGGAWLDVALTASSAEAVEAELLGLQTANPHLGVRTWLGRHLPERLADPALAGLPADQRLKDLPRAGRRALAGLVTAFPLGAPGPVDLAKGEVAAGGVRLAAVDPATLAVRGWENLRVCGELLDIDGPVGGYNLQAAFSTGFLAGSLSPGSS